MPRSALAEVHADAEAVRSRAHVGVLVPWANTMIETELPRVGLEPLVFHYARIVPARRYRESDAFLQQLTAGVPTALAQFERLGLAGVLLGCTTIGFTYPAAPGTAALVGAFEALLAGLRRLEAARVVLATPYFPINSRRRCSPSTPARGAGSASTIVTLAMPPPSHIVWRP